MPTSLSGSVVLDGASLTLQQLHSLARGLTLAELDGDARRHVAEARRLVEKHAQGDASVYGVNTGFGALATTRIPPDRLDDLQRNLVRSHCSGVGPPLPREEVRAAMVLRANVLARGHSGVRVELLETLLTLLNRGVHPVVPSGGSVGASGDLSPLAHIARLLMGEGPAEVGGRLLPAHLALGDVGVAPLTLKAKEGLALINGTQVTTAIGSLVVMRAGDLLQLADVAGAMVIEALKGSVRPFDPRVHALRAHPGQAHVAANLLRLTRGSEISDSHRDCERVQDSYALRCMPQVHGAVRDTLAHAERTLTVEANSSTDNPLVLAADGELIPCGNFHGAPVGYAMDFAGIALADLACMAERRVERLVNPELSGLPAFLARDPGLHSGLMLAQVAAASQASECKTLAHPASVDTIPTSADKEDHVPMSTWAARKCAQILERVETVVAIEMLAAAAALDFLHPLAPGRGVASAHAALREVVPPLTSDRPPAPDIEAVRRIMQDGSLLQAASDAVGGLE